MRHETRPCRLTFFSVQIIRSVVNLTPRTEILVEFYDVIQETGRTGTNGKQELAIYLYRAEGKRRLRLKNIFCTYWCKVGICGLI
jgi:hypothetical protein